MTFYDANTLLLDDSRAAKICLEQASINNYDVILTDTQISNLVEILYLFEQRGYQHQIYQQSVSIYWILFQRHF